MSLSEHQRAFVERMRQGKVTAGDILSLVHEATRQNLTPQERGEKLLSALHETVQSALLSRRDGFRTAKEWSDLKRTAYQGVRLSKLVHVAGIDYFGYFSNVYAIAGIGLRSMLPKRLTEPFYFLKSLYLSFLGVLYFLYMEKKEQEITVPPDLRKVLITNPSVEAFWKDLTPIARRDFITWIEGAKQPETRIRRIEITRSKLLSGQRRPCCYAVVPMSLYKAINGTPKAKMTWKDLTPNERRDFVGWIEEAKNKDEKGVRIEKVCALLSSGKRRV